MQECINSYQPSREVVHKHLICEQFMISLCATDFTWRKVIAVTSNEKGRIECEFEGSERYA